MKRQLDRPRLFISAWYIGAGSLVSVFTNRPNQAFSKLKSIYGNELEKYIRDKEPHAIKQLQITEAERQVIRMRVKLEVKKSNIRILMAFIISVGILIFLIFLINKLANHNLKDQLEF